MSEGEEIVFKPFALPQHPGFTVSKSTASEILQPVLPMSAVVDHHPDVTMAKSISSEVFKPNMPATSDFSSYVTAFSAPLNNGHFQNTLSGSPQLTSVDIGLHPPQQITLFTSKWFMKQDIHLADALKHKRVVENGYDSKSGFAVDMASVQPPSTISHLLPPSAYPINVSISHNLMGAEPFVPSRLNSVVPSVALSTTVSPLPTCPSKNPVSRPVRHFGPPPGFSTISSKQQEEPINGKALTDDQPLEDEYCWLNGYQFSSTTGMGTEKSLVHMPELAPQIPAKSNNMAGMISFPFPGKQIPTMQAQVDHGKRSLDSQFFENRKLSTEQQLYQEPQLDTLPDQYQGQSLWAERYFVLGSLHLLKMWLTVKGRGNIVQLVESFHYLFGVDETCLLQSARHIKWTMVALFHQRCVKVLPQNQHGKN